MMLLVAAALAADLIVDVGEPISLAVGGNWARVLPEDEGWSFFWAAGGDYNRLPMGDDLTVVDRDRQVLTGHTDLVDHVLARCPDGTLLHAASANLESPNDSAYAFRYDAAYALSAEVAVEERRGDVAHNDLPLACGGAGRDLVGFGAGSVVWLGPDLSLETGTLADAPQMQGASFRWDGDALVVYGVNYRGPLAVRRYDADLTPVDAYDLDLAEPGAYIWWPQANLKVGQYDVVAYMSRADGESWVADSGNVWLVVLEDGAVVQKVQATAFAPGQGAMRPGLARRDDRVILSYDVGIVPTLTEVTLDLAEVVVEDTGGDGEGADDAKGCGGCASGAGDGAWPLAWVIGLVGVWARRRDGVSRAGGVAAADGGVAFHIRG